MSPGARFCKKCGTAIGYAKADASATVSSGKSQIRFAVPLSPDRGDQRLLRGEMRDVVLRVPHIRGGARAFAFVEIEPGIHAHQIVESDLHAWILESRRWRLVQSSIRRIDDRCEPHEQSAQAPGDTAFHYDCPLEQGGLETPVSREILAKENPRDIGGISPRNRLASSGERVRLRFETSCSL